MRVPVIPLSADTPEKFNIYQVLPYVVPPASTQALQERRMKALGVLHLWRMP
jgi:hypothetical protein